MRKYQAIAAAALAIGVSACSRDADVASYNLSYAADNFKPSVIIPDIEVK